MIPRPEVTEPYSVLMLNSVLRLGSHAQWRIQLTVVITRLAYVLN